MSKWSRLLDVYDEIECDDYWDDLRQPGIQLVRGDGPETAEIARVMVVGEAPGARENGAGRPFVGDSGRLLDDLMGMAGLDRTMVFVTNVLKYRPPGNRTPFLPEIIHAQDALRHEWSIIKPDLTLLIGGTAHDAMSPYRGVMTLSASVHHMANYKSKAGEPYRYVRSMFHPAFGLRNRKVRPAMEGHWTDLGRWIREEIPEVLDVVPPQA